MTRHHFISNPEARPPTAPSERWHQAFPQGSWSDWPAVRGATANYDMLWVPVTDPNWVNLVNEIVKLAPDTPVIVMSPIPHDTEGLRAINQGARGYCHLYATQPCCRKWHTRCRQAPSDVTESEHGGRCDQRYT